MGLVKIRTHFNARGIDKTNMKSKHESSRSNKIYGRVFSTAKYHHLLGFFLRIVGICFGGAYIGTALANPISTEILSDDGVYGRWPFVFYVFGILGCLWGEWTFSFWPR